MATEPHLKLSEYGYVNDGKVYLKGYLSYNDRAIGEVKISDEVSIKYFEERFKLAEKKVADLIEAISKAENKGSYLMKLIHMRQYLLEFDGLGDFIPLLEQLDNLEKELYQLINFNRERNYQIKSEILDELDEVKNSFDWKDASLHIKEIKDRWIKTGASTKETEEALDLRYAEALAHFYERRRKFFEDREILFDTRMEKYASLLVRIQELHKDINEGTMLKLKPIIDEWKKVGTVPASRIKETFDEYKRIKKDIQEKSKSFRKPRPKADLNSWIRLCEQAEALLDEHPAQTEFKLKKLQESWKKLGLLPTFKKDELIERFKSACEKVNEYGHLYASILRRFPNFDEKPIIERYKIQISQMRYLLGRDQEEFKKLQQLAGSFSVSSSDDTADKMAVSKMQMLKRRTNMKQNVLKELEKALQDIT